MIPLELLAAGETGRICDLDGSPELVNRLREMGLDCGTCVQMVQPGCPCIIAVENHRLSFRGEEAALVFVETATSPAQALPSTFPAPSTPSLGRVDAV